MLSYFEAEAPMQRPSFFLSFSLTIKDKTNISLTFKILHLQQGSFTRKIRKIFTLKIIVSIFVKLFMILVLHLRQFFYRKNFYEKGYWLGVLQSKNYIHQSCPINQSINPPLNRNCFCVHIICATSVYVPSCRYHNNENLCIFMISVLRVKSMCLKIN